LIKAGCSLKMHVVREKFVSTCLNARILECQRVKGTVAIYSYPCCVVHAVVFALSYMFFTLLFVAFVLT
jgi:hypothetical protein